MEIFECNLINYVIIIGKNKHDNFQIIDDAIDTDVWFHVSGEPSCHIILKNTNKLKDIPRQVIKRCAYLCKKNSHSKTQKNTPIIYTQIQNVIKTEIIGQVAVNTFKTIIV